MKRAISIIILISLFCVMPVNAADVQNTSLNNGVYKIKNNNGMYLTHKNSELSVLNIDSDNLWVVKKTRSGAYYLHPENKYPSVLIDRNKGLDDEGTALVLWEKNGNTKHQTWLLVSNNNETYRICSQFNNNRVFTVNDNNKPTLNNYVSALSQQWTFELVFDMNAYTHDSYKQMLHSINGTKPDNIIIHDAKNKTDAELKKLLESNAQKENMIEGEYVVLHLSDELWAMYSDPKKLIDMYDFIYTSQLELVGGVATIYDGKLVYLTNYDSNAPWMYMSNQYCGTSIEGAMDAAREWNDVKGTRYYWGVGHEIGHAFANKATGNLYCVYAGESWCNILNMYGYYKLEQDSYDWARQWVSQYSRDYYGDNGKYSRYNRKDYDTLPDNQRNKNILETNEWVFVKLPMLLIDNYGWDGIQRFFIKSVNDYNNGMERSEDIQNRIDYMAIHLSEAYGMDLSDLFDHWKLNPSANAKNEISKLPKEEIISQSYN